MPEVCPALCWYGGRQPQSLGDLCLHGASRRYLDTDGSSRLLLLHLQTCTALEVALKMRPIVFSAISAVNNDSCPQVLPFLLIRVCETSNITLT